jgi:hypothetical protein
MTSLRGRYGAVPEGWGAAAAGTAAASAQRRALVDFYLERNAAKVPLFNGSLTALTERNAAKVPLTLTM